MNDIRKPKVRLASEMAHTTSQIVLKELSKEHTIYAFSYEKYLHIDQLMTETTTIPSNSVLYLNGINWSQRISNMNKYKDKFKYIIIPGHDWFGRHHIDLKKHFTFTQEHIPRVKWTPEGPPILIGSNVTSDPVQIEHIERKGYLFKPQLCQGLGNILRDWYALFLTYYGHEVHCVLTEDKFKDIFKMPDLIFDHYDAVGIDDINVLDDPRVSDKKYLQEFVELIKSYLIIVPNQSRHYVGVHIRFGDKYTVFKDPHIRIEDTEENKSLIRELVKQIEELNPDMEVKVVSDHPEYDGLHDIRNIRQKEIEDFFTLLYATKVYTFVSTDHRHYSTFSVGASLFGSNDLYSVDLSEYKNRKDAIKQLTNKKLLYII